MKNKILALGLSFTFLFGISPEVNANADSKFYEENIETKEVEEKTYIFNVTNISENQVTLSYAGQNHDDSVVISTDDQYSNITLSQDYFEDNVSLKDEYQIKTNKSVHELNEDNIKKEDLQLIQKYQKPVNMEKDKLPANTETIEVEVGEVFASDPMYTSANVFELGNKENVYTINFDDLRDESPQVGDKYKIYWDGIVMQSYPGQFGEIYRVEKLSQTPNSDDITKEYEIVQIIDGEKVVLKETEGEKTFEEVLKILQDQNPQVGDRYLITSTKSEDGDLGKVDKVEKWMKKDNSKTKVNYDELKKVIDQASSYDFEDKTYASKSVDSFNDALSNAKETLNKSDASQEEVDEACKNLKDAINNLKENEKTSPAKADDANNNQKLGNKANTKSAGVEDAKDDKKSILKNPSTGITSIAPIAIIGMLSGAGYKLSKRNK